MHYNDGQWSVIGIMTYVPECESDKPAVFTKVTGNNEILILYTFYIV